MVNEDKTKAESDELASPQTLEAYRVVRARAFAAEARAYLLEQQLESARRSNGRMVEQMHADRDRAAALSAELDEVRAGHAVAIGIVQTALDAANRKIWALSDTRAGVGLGCVVEERTGAPDFGKTQKGNARFYEWTPEKKALLVDGATVVYHWYSFDPERVTVKALDCLTVKTYEGHSLDISACDPESIGHVVVEPPSMGPEDFGGSDYEGPEDFGSWPGR